MKTGGMTTPPALVCVLSFPHHPAIMYPTTTVKTKNNVAKTIVTHWSTRSSPLAFVFPNKCSAPPVIAPESPALFPFCNKTTTINTSETMTNAIFVNGSQNAIDVQNKGDPLLFPHNKEYTTRDSLIARTGRPPALHKWLHPPAGPRCATTDCILQHDPSAKVPLFLFVLHLSPPQGRRS